MVTMPAAHRMNSRHTPERSWFYRTCVRDPLDRCLDLLFPRSCSECGDPIEDDTRFYNHLCHACRMELYPLHAHFCRSCGCPVPDQEFLKTTPCPVCSSETSPVDAIVSIAPYSPAEPLAQSILSLKHSERVGWSVDLAGMLYSRLIWLRPGTPWHAVVPVPLHSSRQRRRGYNQAELIARNLANQLNIAYYPWLLRRIRATRPQKGGRPERLRNIQGAFRAGGRCDHARLVLVDDVFTTGATTGECARVLSKSGAVSVTIATCSWVPLHILESKGAPETI